MAIQRILIALVFGLIGFWKGPDLIFVKGLEVAAMNERMFSGIFCAVSMIAVFVYTSLREKIGIFNAILIYWIGLSLLAHLFIKATHSLYWHSLLVSASAVLLTILIFETYFFIRRLEEK